MTFSNRGNIFAGEFRLERLAAQAGFSKPHFNRLFICAPGRTPARQLARLRMEGARRLLREQKRRVVAVVLDLGCANSSPFAQRFRRETGPVPRDCPRPG